MTSIKDKFHSLNFQINIILFILLIVHPLLRLEIGQFILTFSLTFRNVLSQKILTINRLTKNINSYSRSFFLILFQDLQTKMIDTSHESGGMYYLDEGITPTCIVAVTSDTLLQWHQHLGHHSLQSLHLVPPLAFTISIRILFISCCQFGVAHILIGYRKCFPLQ